MTMTLRQAASRDSKASPAPPTVGGPTARLQSVQIAAAKLALNTTRNIEQERRKIKPKREPNTGETVA